MRDRWRCGCDDFNEYPFASSSIDFERVEKDDASVEKPSRLRFSIRGGLEPSLEANGGGWVLTKVNERARSRSAARLAAVQALYQQEMEGTPLTRLLDEFHQHRLGATIEDVAYADAEVSFFDDLVRGVDARREEIDGTIASKLAEGWTLERLDRPMRQILRCGTYELIARNDVPFSSVISEYVDVADAFYAKREKGFANGLLDAVAKAVRT